MKRAISILVCAVLALTLCGCSGGYEYPDAGKYTAGNASISEKVDDLDIDWTSGRVEIEVYDGDSVEISEKSSETLSEEMKLRWWLDGSTLRIKYSAPTPQRFVFFSIGGIEKILTVRLPKDTDLEKLIIDASSATVAVSDISAKNVDIDVSSGAIGFSQRGKSDSVSLDSSSGSVNASINDVRTLLIDNSSGSINIDVRRADTISVDTSSGSLRASIGSVGELAVDSSSGSVNAEVRRADKIRIDSSSGTVRLTADRTPDECVIDSSSGSIIVTLPEDAGFTAHIDTSSGSFHCDRQITMKGNDTYVAGNGEGELYLNASSGSITIK